MFSAIALSSLITHCFIVESTGYLSSVMLQKVIQLLLKLLKTSTLPFSIEGRK